MSEVARMVNVHPSIVSKLVRRHGVTPQKRRHPKLDEMEAMLNDGASFSEVARTLRVSPETLRKYFPGMAWGRAQTDEYASMRQREIKAERLAKKRGKLVDRPSVVD